MQTSLFSTLRALRRSLPLLLLIVTTVTAFAQNTGRIAGRVASSDADVFLEGVLITVEGTNLRTTSTANGRFSLNAVPVGTQTLRFQFLGSEPETRTVEVQSDAITPLDVELGGEVIELEALVVDGARLGQALALNYQRGSVANAQFVSADAIGRFPDQNAAEAIGRLPGVSIERDQGEGRFVVIRGIDPNLTSVAIDGVKLASPSTGERATLLDTIPSDTLQALEVYKAVRPDQPGDSVGGYINIRTPSAFDHEGPVARFSLQGNYSDLADAWRGKVHGSYGNLFDDGKIGFMLNASYEERKFGSDNMEADPWFIEEGEDGTEGYVTEELVFRDYDIVRQRTGISGNLEFRPTMDNFYYIRGSWNEYTDTEIRHQGIFEIEEFSEITEDSFRADEVTHIREMKDRTENMRLLALSIGGENNLGNLVLDYRLSYSRAEEDTPEDFEVIYELADTVSMGFTDTRSLLPRLRALGGPDLANPENYELDEVVFEHNLVVEDDLSLEANARYFFHGDLLRSVKTGFLLRQKDKRNDLEVFENDDAPADTETLTGWVNDKARDAFRSGLPQVSPRFSRSFFENQAPFAMERAEVDSRLEDFDSDEKVYAGYLMAELGTGVFDLIVGARIEHTDFKTTGTSYNDDDEVFFASRGSNRYTNFLPGVLLKFSPSDNLIYRLSATQTIARPNFEQTIPGAEIEGDEVTVGNPDLDPLESLNLDASVEYYLQGLGLLSASVFYKDLDNFIYEQTLFQPYGNIDDAEVTTFRNGPSGDIRGIEFSAQRQLTFLPAPFDAFGVYANLTFLDSSATVLAPEEGDPSRKLAFIKQPNRIANVALTYETSKIFVRLAYSYRDRFLDEVGEDETEDRYVRSHGQWDLSTSYRLDDHWTLFANLLNLTNEPFRASFGSSNRLSQFEEYGWSAQAGVRWSY